MCRRSAVSIICRAVKGQFFSVFGGNEMYKALYREYRPEVFEEVIGQEHIVKILRNQLKQNSVSHAYLFCGTRGTGKTTTARLIAKAVNCISDGERPCGECENCKAIKEGTFMDLMEIDAASNNGIDNIRELRESIKYPPSVGRKKVYIIDEVHMLSTAAFNAFLKTLEEPPDNVMFILATTEPQKLPQTILSRCIRMDFRRVSEKQIFGRMEEICQKRNVQIDEDALWLVAANADGSVRDGLTLLDQCISGREGRISREEILDTLGAVGEDTYIEITNAIISKQVSECIRVIDGILNSGKDARQVLMGLMNHYRNLLLTKYVKNPENVLNMSIENVERVKTQSELVELGDINEAIIELTKTGTDINASTQPRILLELAIVKLATGFTSRKLSACMDENGRDACAIRPGAGTAPSSKVPKSGAFDNVERPARPAASGAGYEEPSNPDSVAFDMYNPAFADPNFGDVRLPSVEPKGVVSNLGDNKGKVAHEVSNPTAKPAMGQNFDGPAEPVARSPFDERPKEAMTEGNGGIVHGYDGNMEELWDEVCREASDVKFELAVLHRNSYPRSMSAGEMVISVTNAIAKGLVEKHKQLLMQVLEKLTGTSKHIVVAGSEDKALKAESLDKTVEKAEEILGININLVD